MKNIFEHYWDLCSWKSKKHQCWADNAPGLKNKWRAADSLCIKRRQWETTGKKQVFKYSVAKKKKKTWHKGGSKSSFQARGAFLYPPCLWETAELRTQSSSCVCRPSCALSGWTAPGLSAGPTAGGPLTVSPPTASLWMGPFAHIKINK